MGTKSPQVHRRRRASVGVHAARRQRGAAAVFAAVAIVAMVIAMLLGINIGQLYYAQRDLQKLAVLGALAAVEAGSGCVGGVNAGNTAAAKTRVENILAANLPGGTNVDSLLTTIAKVPGVQLGMVSTTGFNSTTNRNDGLYHFTGLADGDRRINAAVVNLSKSSPSLFGGGFFPLSGPQTLYASATAMQQPLGAFSVGSTLASLNTSSSALLNPLLTALLGTSVNLSALDYQNLAGVQLSLANLMVAAGVNDLNSLLALNTNLQGVQQILVAATTTVNPSVANLLTGLTLGKTQANSSVPLANLLGNIAVGLNPTVQDAASLVPSLNLLDLLQQAGEQAAANNPNGFLSLTGTPSINGLISNYVFLSVQQPMQPSGYGPVGSQAQTAQITVHLRTSVDTSSTGIVGAVLGLLNGILSILGSSLTVAPINLGLDLKVASTTGTLASITCPTISNPSPSATVAVNASAAGLRLGTFNGNAKNNPDLSGGNFLQIQGTGLLGLVQASVGLKYPVPSDGSYQNLGNTSGATAGPFKIYGTPYHPANATAQPHTYIYAACNSTTANPPSCGTTTDPNNPASPIPTADIVTGVSQLLGQLVNRNNLTPVVGNIDLSSILDPLLSTLNTLLIAPLSALIDGVLDPLLAALGIQLASGTVLMNGVETGQQVIVNTALPGTDNF